MKFTHTSKLLPGLFEHIDQDRRISVLNIGPALAETVDFLSTYRCKLYIADLFSELPFAVDEEAQDSLAQQFSSSLMLPANCQIDLCLFWDIFNYLTPPAIAALEEVLAPHLQPTTQAHAFTVHKVKSPQGNQLYSIASTDSVVVRKRTQALSFYTPHGQGALKNMLKRFRVDRSVLLGDGRLELLLRAAR